MCSNASLMQHYRSAVTSSLVDLCQALSAIFSVDPPVYKTPPNPTVAASAHVARPSQPVNSIVVAEPIAKSTLATEPVVNNAAPHIRVKVTISMHSAFGSLCWMGFFIARDMFSCIQCVRTLPVFATPKSTPQMALDELRRRDTSEINDMFAMQTTLQKNDAVISNAILAAIRQRWFAFV